ncbi:MAG: DUF1565 domain-containing protein [bacterium]|nr:DUF1565 domain-containing protein [bacterium]
MKFKPLHIYALLFALVLTGVASVSAFNRSGMFATAEVATEPASMEVAASGVADVYISPSGNDSNSCTSAQPCQTLTRGVAMTNDMKTLQLAAGTYDSTVPVQIRKSIAITGPRSAVVTAEMNISGGAIVYIGGITIRQISKPLNNYNDAWEQFAQIMVRGGGTLWLTAIAGEWQSGNKSMIQTGRGTVYLRAKDDNVSIDYSGNTTAPAVLEIYYDSYFWASTWPGYNLTVKGGSKTVLYASASRVSWLGGTLQGGGGTATSHVVLAARTSDLLFNASGGTTIIRNGNKGIELTMGSEAYVDPTVSFISITTPKRASSGSSFK